MSVLTDAVNEASRQKDQGRENLKKNSPFRSPAVFLAASVILLLSGAGMAGIYLHEEAKVRALETELSGARRPFLELQTRYDALSAEKNALQAKFAEETKTFKEKSDELAGSARMRKYEKETLEADNAQKEKKIAELEEAILKQEARETELMALIEDARKKISQPAPASAPETA